MPTRLPHEPLDEPTDQELVTAANRGDRVAFASLYARHRDWMSAVAHRLLDDPHGADDVVQSAVLHWLDRFPGFVLSGPVRAYLYPVIRHLAIDRARRGRRPAAMSAGLEAIDIAADLPSPSLADAPDLDDALARLPAGQREVILLHFGDGLTLAHIAIALEIPVGTVKSRLGLALAALRENDRLRRLIDPPG